MSAADTAAAPGSSRRLLPVLAPAVYVVALGVSIAAWGLPLARDQLFFWLGLGMVAFSVATWRSWGRLIVEWLPFLALLVGYDFARGAVSVPIEQAHIVPQVRFDEWIAGGAVPTVWLQERLFEAGDVRWYDVASWAVYMTHFFVVWVVAAVLWRVAHHRFRRYVALTVTLTAAGLLTYWLWPAQPPWLAGDEGTIAPVQRIVPEVWGHLGVSTAASVWEGHGDLVNLVAAMPSLHAAYPFMLLLFFWPAGWAVRAALLAYAVAMGFVLVYGGEHFVLDILVGWAYALVALGIVEVGTQLLRRRQRASEPSG
jgi:hypothetical protein